LGEDIGVEMSLRTFDHLLHYGELPIKRYGCVWYFNTKPIFSTEHRVVPLAMALLHISNPDYAVVDSLSRLSHDGDGEVAQV
jgi:26S proteasome regulatory subunit N1